MTITKHLRIHGRVQGVWFRESMRIEAERLGVTGWVRNRSDGSVEAVVQGPAEAVRRILEWSERGPEGAMVLRVEATDADGEYGSFEKRPSA